jgi:threonine dehydrogenase-like Zn-dependent dehydrogenase
VTQTIMPPASSTAATTMQATVITAPGRMEMREVRLPRPRSNEVRVKLQGCGVCASNIPPWEGREWFHYPLAPGQLGHEGWGYIDAVGEDVLHFSVGQRVAMLSEKAYAEYDVAGEDQVIALPESLSEIPFPAEPLGCAMNIFDRSGIQGGDNVAIVGIGFLGSLLTRLATDAGARVLAISRRASSLELARQMGATQTIAMEDHGRIIETVRQITNGRFCDVVIEAVGKQWPLDLSAEITRERGRLIVAGYHQDGPRQINMQLWNWRGIDVINAHERDPGIYLKGMRNAAGAVGSGRLDPMPLYTHRFPLNRLDEALNMTRDRPDGFIKALIMIGSDHDAGAR